MQIIETESPQVASEAGPGRGRMRGFGRALALAAITALTVGGSTALAASPAPSATGAPATAHAPATAPDAAKLDAAFRAYASCMRDHGVDMPGPMTIGAGATTISGAATIVVDGGAVGDPPASGAPVLTAAGVGTTQVGSLEAGSTSAVPIVAGPTEPAFAAADKACAPILEAAGIHAVSAGASSVSVSAGADLAGGATLPAGGTFAGAGAVVGVAGGDAASIAAMADQVKAYAACMRDHGVDVPDPKVDAKAGTLQLSITADPTTAAFRAADAACGTDGFRMAPPAGK